MVYKKNEEAVSPVIGVILMVVITVIIAAVLAVFAFGVGAPTKSPTVSVKITSMNATNNTLWVQHYGGDSIRLKDTKITVETLNADGSITNTTNFDIATTATGQFSAGDTMQINIGSTYGLILKTVIQPLSNIPTVIPLSGDSVRVTIIDTPSGSVLSKPSAKIT